MVLTLGRNLIYLNEKNYLWAVLYGMELIGAHTMRIMLQKTKLFPLHRFNLVPVISQTMHKEECSGHINMVTQNGKSFMNLVEAIPEQ